MRFLKLKQSFYANDISKPEYISQAIEIHDQLFEYSTILQHTDIRQIIINRDEILFEFNTQDMKFVCPAHDSRTVPIEVLNFNFYEPRETKMLLKLVKGLNTILDIGANIGWFSILLAKTLPAAKIYAFEPIPQTFTYLIKNIYLNERGSQILPFNFALSDQAGVSELYFNPAVSGNASLLNVSESSLVKKINCPALCLDNFVENYNISPDLIKCDVEGAELLVFKGGVKMFARFQPIVFTEMLRKWSKPFGYHPNDIIKFFADLGYVCLTMVDERLQQFMLMDDNTVETNFFFLHKIKHKELLKDLCD